ncbi:hypothetical protein D3C72_1249350 [compost metagenome]
MFVGQRSVLLLGQHAAVDFQDGRGRVVQQRLDRRVQRAELRQQLAHMLRAAARCGLIRHRGHPLDQVGLEQAAQADQHAADRAVAADEILDALGQRVLDHTLVDRIQHDDGIVLHAQRGRRVDPVALPAGFTQLGEDLVGVVTALGGQHHVALLQCLDVVGILERGFVLGHRRCLAARVRGREEDRLDEAEVAFGLHAVHEDRADHAAPAHEAEQRLLGCVRHFSLPLVKKEKISLFCPRLVGRGRA